MNSRSSWIVRTYQVDCPLVADRAARARVARNQHHLPFARSPKSTKRLLPNHRWRSRASKRWYTYKFVASSPLNREESRFYRDQPKSFGSNWNPSIRGQIRSLSGQDQAQRCTRHLSIIPIKKAEPKHLRIEGTIHTRKSNENSLKKTRKSLEPQEGNRCNHECFHTLKGQILYKPVKKI
jgi:hypothetical protein